MLYMSICQWFQFVDVFGIIFELPCDYYSFKVFCDSYSTFLRGILDIESYMDGLEICNEHVCFMLNTKELLT